MGPAKILIGDPQDLILEGLCRILEPIAEVVAAVADAATLLEAALALSPDLIAADIGLLEGNGKDFDLLHRIRILVPNVKFLCLVPPSVVGKGFPPEIAHCLPKTSCKEAIVAWVTAILNGLVPQWPVREHPDGENTGGSELTTRQRAILHMIAAGKSSKEMAYDLKISVRTVEYHRANLRSRLGVRSTAELTRRALSSA